MVDEPLGDQNLSVDGVLDTVAGKSFGAYVAALRPTGVLSLVGAVGGSNVSFDAYRLLEVKLTGYASDTLDGAALRRAISSISEWVSRGIIRAPVRSVFPLQEAAAAHAKLEQHLVQGRVLLVAPVPRCGHRSSWWEKGPRDSAARRWGTRANLLRRGSTACQTAPPTFSK